MKFIPLQILIHCEAEAGDKFKTNLGYMLRPFLKNQNKILPSYDCDFVHTI
jgi:hypothetical protein